MRGIFVKIYTAFVVTSLITTLVTLLLAMYYRQWSNDSINLIAPTGGYISAAELMLQRGGEPLLLEWLLTFDRHPSVNAYVIDNRGLSLTPKVPEGVLKYALAADSYSAQVNVLSQSEILVKAPLKSTDGKIYLLVVEFLHPLAVFNLPAYLAWGVAASFLLFALWGFLLSRYLTRPLLSLQRSVKAFANGQWPVYLSPKLLKRQDEIGELGREFEQMAQRIQRLLADQRQLLSDVSHELRSPLARSAIALELARLDTVPEQAEYLDRIELENQRLNDLIEDLLNMARLEVRQNTEQWQRLNCGQMLQQVIDDAQFEYAHNSVCFTQPEKPVWVSGDERLLLSAFENIIRNALIHTAENTAIEVELCDGEQIEVRIRDHGTGVPENILKDLLRPFVRAEQARERSLDSLQQGNRGFGLGLAIAQRVISHHRGQLRLQNAEGGGLEALMVLPKAATE